MHARTFSITRKADVGLFRPKCASVLCEANFSFVGQTVEVDDKLHVLSKQKVVSLTLNQSYFRFHISNTDHIIDVVQGRLVKHF